jgi:tetratricopeptide (TPR) repeat protein
LIGGVLATTGLLGAYTAGIDPPDSLRELAGTKVAKPTTPAGRVPGPAPVVQPVGVVVSNNLRTGDLDAIKSEDLDRIDEAKPEELTMRAEARWLLYVREQRGKGLRPDAEPVKQAMTDLGKAVQAGNADALFLRAGIHKRTGNIPAARADYQEGVKKFAADPDQKERFEAALDALSLNAAHLRPAGVPLTMLLVFGYQPAPEPTPKQPSEPAPKFARAIKLASEGKFAEAIKLVDEAKSLHDERRSLFPNKPINPRTVPERGHILASM